MRWSLLRPDTERLWRSVGPALRVAAEAGFLTVVYAALSVTFGHQAPVLGPVEFTLLVALGAAVNKFAERNPGVGATALTVALVGAGICGWLASPEARAVAGVSIPDALRVHVIGWLGAVAFLRGSLIRGTPDSTMQLEPLLRTLLPAVAVIWAVAWRFAPPDLLASFVVYAMWGSLALIVSGLTGLGLTRLRAVHANVETRVRSLWRWIVIALAVSVVPLAMPFVLLAGAPVELLFQPLAGPLSLVGELLLVVLAVIVEILVPIITPLARGIGEVLARFAANLRGPANNSTPSGAPTALDAIVGSTMTIVLTLVIVYAIFLLARWLVARPRGGARSGDPRIGTLEHAIVVPVADPPRPPGAARRRPGAAHDAVSAYISAIDALAAHPRWARAASETPAEHSSRVRAADMPDAADLSRLAADYQIARYAERPITSREDRRALFRLDRLRRALR